MIGLMGLYITALVGLLSATQTQGKCTYHEMFQRQTSLFINITCINNVDDLMTELEIRRMPNEMNITLRNITDLRTAIRTLKLWDINHRSTEIIITGSNISALPNDLFTNWFSHLHVTHNNMPVINLNLLTYSGSLIELTMSHNGIEEFETESATYMSTKMLNYIDLSYNKISRIPVNCFYSTRDSLKILNLSHNRISTFDYFAFSSLTLLETLLLSHNKLVRLDTFLYPLRNLHKLHLDHNQVQEIDENVFGESTHLTELDLSFNNIERVENRSFSKIRNLVVLNLSHNNVTSIKKILFRNNIQLQSLDLSHNHMCYVEPGTFSSMESLTSIGLEEAFDNMTILEDVFAGAKAKQLNFAGSKINKIKDRTFISLKNSLVTLNLSSSSILEISEKAFDTLTKLTELDLSNNQLSEIAFRTVDLENLSKLYIRNNKIRELKPTTFDYLFSLTELDLSDNDIHTIPAMTFKNLKNLKIFNVANNKLDSTLVSNTFFDLEKVDQLELINTTVRRWDSYALSGLKSMKVLNASYGELAHIDYYAFTETGNIVILDLSHNQLQNFNVLISNVKIRKMYLNNNLISSFSKSLFRYLNVLEILNLSNNNIFTIESLAFSSLRSLILLDLSHNPYLKLGGNAIDTLSMLNTVLLNNVSSYITFETGNVAITNLNLSSSGISNLSLLHLYNIKSLNKLDLSYNNLTVLDHLSFGGIMHSLTWLNLNNNKLVSINPGTFFKTTSILYLDLSYNSLKRIQFGALSGLDKLLTLNLSNNLIHSFKMSLLYNVQSVSLVFLDNNKLYSLGVNEQIYNLKKLSVGGNELTCNYIVDVKKRYKDLLTAETLNYNTENVDGIACAYDSSTSEEIIEFTQNVA